MTKRLSVEQLGKHFGGVHVFENVSFAVPERGITALIGPNGAGKSTLINIACGVLPADSGGVLLDGKPSAIRRPHQAAGCGLARTFQDVRLFPTMTALENVMVALPGQPGDRLRGLLSRRWRRAEEANRKLALELLARLELAGVQHALARDLPFGTQKLVGLARAIATGASTLLLDEPSTGLELSRLPLLTSLLAELRQNGRTVLLVEHNVDLVAEVADQVVVLQGTVIASGSAEQVLRDEQVIREYLGRLYDA